MSTDDIRFFQSALEQVLGQPVKPAGSRRVSGGDINHAARLDTDDGSFFIKWQNEDVGDMFEKEAHGIALLSNTDAISIPTIHGHGCVHGKSYLIMEFVEPGAQKPNFWQSFGQSLADIHKTTQGPFGLDVDNYIGKLPQPNQYCGSWSDFFINHRLQFQTKYGLDHGSISSSFAHKMDRFCLILDGFFPVERPALLHGDLWSGNFMSGTDGQPVVYDPAVYYGHREMELAFTHLFGGFQPGFYDAYQESSPLETGFDERVDVYNTYPLLVHANLFGGSYLHSVERIINRFI